MKVQLARRPGFCTEGAPYDVLVNAFELRSLPSVSFVHYDVVLSPNPQNAKRARDVIHRLMNNTAPAVFSQVVAVFDGVKNLYSLNRPLFQEGTITFNVNMSDTPPTGPNPRGVFTVTLTRVADITPNELVRVLQGHATGVPISTTPIQALNVLLQQAAALRLQVRTKQKFYTRDGHQSVGCFEIWRGFFASIRPTIGRLILNVDTSSAVMYRSGDLIGFVLTYCGWNNEVLLGNLREGHDKWPLVRGILKGIKVRTRPNNRLRTIKIIIEDGGAVEFFLDNGTNTTVQAYYLERYGINLRHPNFPGIQTSRDEVIPFELCTLEAGQMLRKKASPELTSEMLKFSKHSPEKRLNMIQDGMRRMQLADSPFTVQAGIQFSNQPMSVRGRVIGPPSMLYGRWDDKGVTEMPESPRNGSWNMVGKVLRQPMKVNVWAIVSLDRTIHDESIMKFAVGLRDAMRTVGMDMSGPPRVVHSSPHRIKDELESLCNEAKIEPLLLVILPKTAAPLRKEVKQFGDIQRGVVTQCVRSDNMLRANSQYYNNLILKINAKMGGINTAPVRNSPSSKWFQEGKTMIVGADVSHPGPGVRRPSVAALVSSVDKMGVRYIAKCTVQGPRSEMIENLEDLMDYALSMYSGYRGGGELPERIVFYRDGVSEGEIQQVAENEIVQIMKSIYKVYSGRPPAKLTFVIVGKGHHFRFIPNKGLGADKSGNAPAGLVVDQGITAPGIFDFYILSHAGLLGTSRPSHYIVVKDDNELGINGLSSFSFDLCHTYARATRSVSIPAPVYYADIACARADFHFDPGLNYDDDLTSTGEFDLDTWRSGFQNAHPRQSRRMYFM